MVCDNDTEPSRKKRRTCGTVASSERPSPPTTVSFDNAANRLYQGSGFSSSFFFSRKRKGYKLQLALKSVNDKPTSQCPKIKPKVEISVMAPAQDADSQLTWPFNGTAKVRFKKSLESKEFNGGRISIKFFIETPSLGSQGPLPVTLQWKPVPEGCIPGEINYLPSECPGNTISLARDAIETTIPSTLYVLVEKVIHHKLKK